MGTPDLTDQQIQRDNFLRQLAISPADGLLQWKRLTQGEQTVVVIYMGLFYDVEFARHFLAQANKHARPDLVINITNSWELDPTKLQRMGFRRKGTVGNTQIWVNPSGKEVWLLPSAKAVAPPPVIPPIKQVHPDIQEIQLYKQDYQDQKDDLYRRSKELARLKDVLPSDEYARRREQWITDYEEYEESLDDKLKNVIPSQVGQLTPEEQEAKDQAVQELDQILHRTPIDFFPPNP
jgi:hypothetical protein